MRLDALINALETEQADEDYTPTPIKCGDCDFVEICVRDEWLQWVYRCADCDVYFCYDCRPKHGDICKKCACAGTAPPNTPQ
jgi:hypothetical protein